MGQEWYQNEKEWRANDGARTAVVREKKKVYTETERDLMGKKLTEWNCYEDASMWWKRKGTGMD